MPSLPFQPCPGVAECTLQWTSADNDVMENIFHVHNGTGDAWTGAQLAALLAGIVGWLTAGDGAGHTYPSLCSTDGAFTGITCRDLTTSSGPRVTQTLDTPGTASGTQLQQGLTKSFTLRTGLAGRSQRGRFFAVGMSLAAATADGSDTVTSTYLGQMILAFGHFQTAIHAVNAAYTWGVLSRYHQVGGVTTRRDTGVTTPITEVGFSHVAFDYQRRRAPFHARHH